MITLCRRTFVSTVAITTITLALGACVSAGSRPMVDRPMSAEASLLAVRFDNLSRETVDVYLISTTREWMLGRVAPGAVASLPLPEGAFAEGSMKVRLAVLAGGRQTLAAALDPRAVLTNAQPASAFLSERWTFSLGNLTSLPYQGR